MTRRHNTALDILITPDFNIAATMAFVDPFRVANYLEGATLFQWRFLSEQGGAVQASNGAWLETAPLGQLGTSIPDYLVVSSSWRPEAHTTAAVKAALRRAATAGTVLGALDTGAFVLGYAGLLKGHRATVHYEHIDAFQEVFPDTEVSEALWVLDGPRLSCSGGIASTEFALHLLRARHGAALANAAARYLFASGLRDPEAPQAPPRVEPLGATVPDMVRRAIALMEAHLETPLAIATLCARLGISHRQLNRLFALVVGQTPRQYYRDIRLDRARGLVTQTTLPMTEIAQASGFSAQAPFSRAYRARFGLTPSKDRVVGRIPFEFRAWPMHPKDAGQRDATTKPRVEKRQRDGE